MQHFHLAQRTAGELTTQRRKAWTAPEHQQRRAQRAADKRRIERTHASKELFQ